MLGNETWKQGKAKSSDGRRGEMRTVMVNGLGKVLHGDSPAWDGHGPA